MQSSQQQQLEMNQQEDDDQQEIDLLGQLPISEEEMLILAENGFDDIESFKFLNIEVLEKLGIQNAEEVVEVVQQMITDFQEYEMQEQKQQMYEVNEESQEQVEDGDDQEQQQQQYEYGEEEDQAYENGETVNLQVKPLKFITTKLIVQTLIDQQAKLSKSAAIQQGKTLQGPQLSTTLSKLTHLKLNNKRIQKIGEEIENQCKSLKVLYLYDNMIQEIEGLGGLKNLIQLSLYNNQIVHMSGMESLVSLRKLYLEKNQISRLQGLTSCRQLEELYLSQQDIQTDFTFDDYSLAAISGSLKYLDLSDSRVVEPKPLYYLERLEVLILKKNRISDFEDHICPLLQTMSSLRQLDLTDNPVNSIPKYRDQIIILTGNRLQEIDNKKVSQQERTYLMQLVQRKQRQVLQPGHKGVNQAEEKKASGNGGAGGFGIQGKNKQLHHTTDIGHALGVMQATGGSYAGMTSEEGDTQNQFYSPIDDIKHQQALKTKTNINNPSYQSGAYAKKRSANLNSNSDFTTAGVSHQPTKHVPQMRAQINIKK